MNHTLTDLEKQLIAISGLIGSAAGVVASFEAMRARERPMSDAAARYVRQRLLAAQTEVDAAGQAVRDEGRKGPK